MSNILYACNVVQYHHKKCLDWDFPGGPVVKTLCFHCRGRGFDPWLGKFRMPHSVAKKKKKKKNVLTISRKMPFGYFYFMKK